MTTQSSWIHGVAVKPEFVGDEYFVPVEYDGTKYAYTELVGLPQGPGGTWRGRAGTTSWFHVALPTPTLVDGAPVSLTKLTVAFKTEEGAFLGNVHAWDGANRIVAESGLQLQGAHNGTDGNEAAAFALDQPQPVTCGLIVSLSIQFENEAEVQISGVGGEFSY